VLPRNCCPFPQTLMHIFPDTALQLFHQCCADTPNAAALVHSCCPYGSPAQLNTCTVAAQQMPRRCCTDAVTLVSILNDANAQISDADAQILRRSCATLPSILRCCLGPAAQVPGTATQMPDR
jgi:hypothetical protein